MKKRFSFLLLIISISIAVSSCTLFSKETTGNVQNSSSTTNIVNNETPLKGGVIRLFSTYPDTLNPIITKNKYVQDILKNVFEGLVFLDYEQKPMGALAESWKVSSDGLIWTFNIRKNVKFQDDTNLTSEDVEYTISTIMNSGVDTVYKMNVENIATIAATDRYTIKIVLKTPYSFTPELMTFPIISKKAYSDGDFYTMSSTANKNPVGTGPYSFKAYYEKSEIILEENTGWWKSNVSSVNGLSVPFIKELDVKLYKNGINAIKAIQAKDIDVAFIYTDECGKYFGRYDLTVNKYQNKNFEFVSLNVTNRALSDPNVRQAISYAINKSKIIGSVLSGKAIQADYPIVSNSWLAGSNFVMTSNNASKAKSILANAGWSDNGSGVLHKYINGSYTTLNFELLVNSGNKIRLNVANKIAAQLKTVGINVTVKSVDWDSENSLIRNKNYDMAILGWEISSIPDVSFAYSTKDIATGLNVSGYSNAAVDELLNKINLENDSSKKKTLYSDMFNIINQEVPYIGLYFYNDAVLYSRRVSGILSPCTWNRFNDLPNWYLNVSTF
ncbi:MAG: peptide ABC transporter substrate-binding protein [Clostridia bacterium]